MVNARPNLNGNTPKDFNQRALRLSKALATLEAEINEIAAEVCHGRNYQTTDNPAELRNEDIERLKTLRTEHLKPFHNLVQDIFIAANGGDPYKE